MMTPQTSAEQALGITLPSRRDEEWKWTDLKRLVDKAYVADAALIDPDQIERLKSASPFAKLDLPRVVIVNGELHTTPKGIAVSAVAPVFVHNDPLLELNKKLGAKSICLTLSGEATQTIEVLYISNGEGASVASRLHVSLPKGARATILETFVGEGEYLNNPVTTLDVGIGARLDRIKFEGESGVAQHLSHVVVTLAERATFNDYTLTAGSALNRQNANIDFNGQNSSARVSGSYLLKGQQHADTRLVVDHKVANCLSRELYKCVMDDRSRGIFQGKVIVRPDAQKIDGKQSSHALLLSETSEFDAKPELEIYADDVVCGHGTTCGDLNHDHLFYLKSRGIPESQARAMLVHAFLAEAIETVESEPIKDALLAIVAEKMS